MTQVKRVVDAIKGSGVERVAIVDDAFDPPTFKDDDWGAILTFLEGTNADIVREEANISREQWDLAIEAIQTTDYDSEDLSNWLESLYAAYVSNDFNPKFDPAQKFNTTKGTNLSNVRPLIALIRKCKPEIEILTYGATVSELDPKGDAHVVFVDLFLDATIGATENPSSTKSQSAVQASLKRIEPLMALSPSVILMSSHSGRSEAKAYRSHVTGGSVYASRFAFIEKTKITQPNSKTIQLHPEAGEALLDIFQSYKFGRSLHHALNAWVESAKDAVTELAGEIEKLELRDIAYLVRFRLAAEGQSLPDYLEWLLAECLVDELGKKLHKRAQNPEMLHLSKESAEQVEGAFDGPTKKVADLYHRVRIEDARTPPREHFRLGDLYLCKREDATEHLIAVMNPDCDLVTRLKGERGAESLLTVRGDLQEFDAPQTSVGDFIVVGGRPRNIKWNYKAVRTIPFEGAMASPGKSEGNMTYLGALRPLYAQEIQDKLLNQLGRVGVAVPPALAFAATVSLTYISDSQGTRKRIELHGKDDTQCYFVPARETGTTGVAVFKRQFVRNFLESINKIDVEKLDTEAAKQVAKLKNENSEAKLVPLTAAGLVLEETIGFGVALTAKTNYKPTGSTWCWITLSMANDDEKPQVQMQVSAQADVTPGSALEECIPITTAPDSAPEEAAAIPAETKPENKIAPGTTRSEVSSPVLSPEVIATTGLDSN